VKIKVARFYGSRTLIQGLNARLANRPFLFFDFHGHSGAQPCVPVPEKSQQLKTVG